MSTTATAPAGRPERSNQTATAMTLAAKANRSRSTTSVYVRLEPGQGLRDTLGALRSAAVVLRLPEPMLARAGMIPRGRGWTFEPKLDGFRCMVCTHAGFRARSRRGWDMTHLLPEFRRSLPDDVQLDGEIVALAADGRPDFHRLSSRMLHGRGGIAVTYFVFDLLAVAGLPTTMQAYSERRAILEELELENHDVKIVASFEDGPTLFRAVCARGLEGVVAKRDSDPYRPGDRSWVKTKNRATARFAEERDGDGRRARRAAISPGG